MRLAWVGVLTALGVLAVLPITMTASGLARWDERGPEGTHHADSVVAGRVSPWPVDSDEQIVAVGLGGMVTAVLVAAAVTAHRLLRRRMAARPVAGPLLGAALWCAPSVAYWLSWPAA